MLIMLMRDVWHAQNWCVFLEKVQTTFDPPPSLWNCSLRFFAKICKYALIYVSLQLHFVWHYLQSLLRQSQIISGPIWSNPNLSSDWQTLQYFCTHRDSFKIYFHRNSNVRSQPIVTSTAKPKCQQSELIFGGSTACLFRMTGFRGNFLTAI